jgi:hypothetical protein
MDRFHATSRHNSAYFAGENPRDRQSALNSEMDLVMTAFAESFWRRD